MSSSRFLAAVVITATGLLLGCGTTTSAPSARTEPVVDQPGRYISRYQGPLLEALVDYEYAASSQGDEWMILNVGVSGTEAATQEIRVDEIWLRTPDGTRIPLPTYSAFAEAYPQIQSASRRAALASDPLGFTRGNRRWCHMAFHPTPGTSAVLTAVHVNFRQFCSGMLYFPVPGGIQPGRYALAIRLTESEILVPFVIGG